MPDGQTAAQVAQRVGGRLPARGIRRVEGIEARLPHVDHRSRQAAQRRHRLGLAQRGVYRRVQCTQLRLGGIQPGRRDGWHGHAQRLQRALGGCGLARALVRRRLRRRGRLVEPRLARLLAAANLLQVGLGEGHAVFHRLQLPLQQQQPLLVGLGSRCGHFAVAHDRCSGGGGGAGCPAGRAGAPLGSGIARVRAHVLLGTPRCLGAALRVLLQLIEFTRAHGLRRAGSLDAGLQRINLLRQLLGAQDRVRWFVREAEPSGIGRRRFDLLGPRAGDAVERTQLPLERKDPCAKAATGQGDLEVGNAGWRGNCTGSAQERGAQVAGVFQITLQPRAQCVFGCRPCRRRGGRTGRAGRRRGRFGQPGQRRQAQRLADGAQRAGGQDHQHHAGCEVIEVVGSAWIGGRFRMVLPRRCEPTGQLYRLSAPAGTNAALEPSNRLTGSRPPEPK